jgi:CBS-domain-containing membrane protein
MSKSPLNFTAFMKTPLNQILGGLGDAGKVKTVKTTDTIAHLTGLMRCFNIRTVPVLDAKTGKLVGVVSLVDVAKVLTPRNTKLPIEYLTQKNFDMTQLHNANEEMRKKTVGEVFKFLFDLNIPVVVWTETLENTIKKLILRDENNRRNRTLVILDAGDRVVGTFSYVDALRIIRDGIGINAFLIEYTANVVLTSKVVTLTQNEYLEDAMYIFDEGLFTHLPVTTVKDGNIVVGIVDDVAAATLEHKLLFDDLHDYPLGQMMTKVSDKNTVSPNCPIKTLIGKFVDGHERPTAILVGNYQGEDFTMAGIISYVDIFRKLLEFVDEMNRNKPE